MREVEITIKLVGTEEDAAELVEAVMSIADWIKKDKEESDDED
jgi:hypothetical protein